MAYSKESLAKVIQLMNEKKNVYNNIPVEEIKLCISKGNVKIGRVMNVSIPPIITCHHCKECKHYCYDVKACLQYPNTVIDARIRNYMILMKDRNEYFNRISKAMKRRKTNKYFRWHVAGDIIDYDYFDRMVENAKANPDFIVWTYTKEYETVNEWIRNHGETKESLPKNFTVMFSEWRGLEMKNPYGLPEFRVVMKDDENKPDPTKNHYCPGNCDICKKCKRGCVAGETTYCNEH